MRRGWSARRDAFVQALDDDVLDASLLMMPMAKFVSPTDPKWLSTLDALTTDLVSDSLVYRYDPAVSPDGLHGPEGTFSICSFWYVEALARAGRLEEARLAFEEDAHLRQPSRSVRRGDRPDRRTARQLPPGLHPPLADQRRLQPRPRAGLTQHHRRCGGDATGRRLWVAVTSNTLTGQVGKANAAGAPARWRDTARRAARA